MNLGKFLYAALRMCFFAVCTLICVDNVCAFAGFDVVFLAWLPEFDSGGITLLLGATVIAPFPVDPELTAIAIAYRNKSYIADGVMPRRPVGLQNFKYRSYAKGTFLTIPETVVSRTGTPNRVEIGYSESDSSTIDHALDDSVPVVDINNAPPGYDPVAAAVEFITDLNMLDREKRVADMAFDTGNYAAANQTTLSGSSQFSHVDSTPITTIQDAIDACFFRPNVCVMGRAVASKLFTHADIVKAVHGTSGDSGIARREQFASLFEFDEVLIGEGWYNSAKPGQTVTVVRVWGKSMLLFYRNLTADVMRGTTFGVTAQFGSKLAGQFEDKDSGMRGGIRVRAGESVREVILANDLGYLIDAAVA